MVCVEVAKLFEGGAEGEGAGTGEPDAEDLERDDAVACSSVGVGHPGHMVDGGLARLGACHAGWCGRSIGSDKLKRWARRKKVDAYESA